METWVIALFSAVLVLLTGTGLFLFTVTRGALVVRRVLSNSQSDAAHVYPIYSNMRLIRLIDFQPIISAILLFQYHRLVSAIVEGLHKLELHGQKVLITSCAFGNVIPRVVSAAIETGADKVMIADIIRNELTHAESKLLGAAHARTEMLEQNAVSLKVAGGSVAANVIFFLLHELPHPLKIDALREAGRVTKPGGKIFLAEFHRPERWVLRALSWTYFKVFEPLGLALWDSHDPVSLLDEIGGFSCERHTYFCGNFQIIIATKNR
ncbi:MAG: class I SAM-dependent methyltransferase [Gammaproteobacteria bacterium]|nr:class I SAM-dependent methyltransferase [Gammaproteobacteria bacterium]